MKRKIFITSILTSLVFAASGAIILMNINTIIQNGKVRDVKTTKQRSYYLATSDLESAQMLLFRHQAGYGRDIDGLVSAVESFDERISALERSYVSDARPAVCYHCHEDLGQKLDHIRNDLHTIQSLTESYKATVSIMITTSDRDHRMRLYRASSELGTRILAVLAKASASFDRMVEETITLNNFLIARARRTIVLTMLGIIAVLLVVLFITVPSITRSVNALIGGTEAIAAGNFSQRLDIPSGDEIGLLASRFNRMAQSLQERDRELSELHTNLERKVLDRTLELEASYEQLRQTANHLEEANRELSELDRMKSDFISIASHELRTPLVTISGYITLLKEGKAGALSQEQQDMVEIADKSAKRLTRITKSILDISRLELKKGPCRRDPLSLERVISEAVADQQPFAELRNQALIFHPGLSLPSAWGDENMLLQVFINLINNAIKYTPNGGRISLSLEAFTGDQVLELVARNRWLTDVALPGEDSTYLCAQIADSGVGIPLADQKKVFEKFYEVGDVMAHSTGEFKFMGGGMGLGLAIARGFVLEHDGFIWVESPGRDVKNCPGSRFYVVLPAIGSITPPGGGPEPDRRPAAVGRSPGNRLLLIDDDTDIVKYMQVLLDGKCDLHVAGSGREGLDRARELAPDMILLDLLMYDVDGYEVTRRLKEDPGTRDIPVVLFTAKAQKEEIERGLASGADDYLVKPFSHEDLFAKLDTYLSKQPRASGTSDARGQNGAPDPAAESPETA